MNRIEKFLEIAEKENFKAALVTSEANKYYFTGTQTPEAGTLIILPSGAYYIVDSRYIEVAQNNITSAKVILQDKLYSQVNEILKENSTDEVWVEDSLTIGELNGLRKCLSANIITDSPLTAIVAKQRSIKDEKEQEYIRTAQKLTDEAFKFICTQLAPGKREIDMALDLENFMKRNGATGLAFNTILISGAKTSMPHGVPGDKIIETGDFVTMDYSASYKGYCSDMTRTVAIGKVSDEMKYVYDTVLQSQLLALDGIKAGVKCCDVDKIARDYIYSHGFEGCFGHSLGHSYGIEIHERPFFAPSDSTILEEGVMITIEPGIYLPGKFGVRIEDTVRVTADGCVNLTKSPKELIIL